MAKWAIQWNGKQSYYRLMTGIGPAFGGTKKQAIIFPTKREAEAEINRFPVIAAVESKAVKISP